MHEPAIVDAVVVGGGLSGLATAFALQRRGIPVEVLESSDRAGGVIASIRRGGALYETGPNSALDSPAIATLLDALGIAGERIATNPRASTRYIVRDGKLVALPMSPPAFIASRAFSWRAKWRLAREPFIAPAPADADESVAAFVARRLGRELLDYAIDPFVAGVYAGDPERLSLPAAFPRLHALEQRYGSLIKGQLAMARERRSDPSSRTPARESFSFRRGMQTLTDALARSLSRVTTHTCVERLERDASGACVVTVRSDGEVRTLRARALVLAVPADVAGAFMRELAPNAAQALSAIEYAPVASIASLYRRSDVAHPLDGFGCLVPKRERRQILGTLFSSSVFDDRAPPGEALLTTFVGGTRQPELPAKSDAVLEQVLQVELATLVGAHAAPQWSAITRWPQAIPQYTLGHRVRMSELDAAERTLPGLFFRANYRGGVSVGDCIASAQATADAVASFLGGK